MEDGRRLLTRHEATYDLVIGDLFNIARSGASAAYSVDFLTDAKEALSNDGLCCMCANLR